MGMHRSPAKPSQLSRRALVDLNQAILDSASYAIIASDPSGTVQVFNAAAERLLGYTAEEVIGQHTPVLWHDPEEMRQVAIELGLPPDVGYDVFVNRSRSQQAVEREWTFIAKDGRRIPVLLSVSATRNEAGEITGYLGIATDTAAYVRRAAGGFCASFTACARACASTSPSGSTALIRRASSAAAAVKGSPSSSSSAACAWPIMRGSR